MFILMQDLIISFQQQTISDEEKRQICLQLLTKLKEYRILLAPQVKQLDALLERKQELIKMQKMLTQRSQLNNLCDVVDEKLKCDCFDLESVNTLKVILELSRQLGSNEEEKYKLIIEKKCDKLLTLVYF
jgi:hypothetical protein